MPRYVYNALTRRVLLLDTPVHGNLGDQAIAYAESQILEQCHIRWFETLAVDFSGCEGMYAALTPSRRTVLVTGGGFLGSLWPGEEYRVRRILQAYKKNKVIILPQTVYFDMDSEAGRLFFEESKRLYSAHPNLTVFLREKHSFDFMQKNMPDVHIELAPDMVTYLHPTLPSIVRKGVLLCLRGDKESTLSPCDREKLLAVLRQEFSSVRITDTVIDRPVTPKRRLKELTEKWTEFAGAELVVTDRLHGMIFAAITGTPCIVVDSKSPKVKGCYDWITGLGYIWLLNDMDELRELTARARRSHGSSRGASISGEQTTDGFEGLVNEIVFR